MSGSSERKTSLDSTKIWLRDLPTPGPLRPPDCLRPLFYTRKNRREKGPAHVLSNFVTDPGREASSSHTHSWVLPTLFCQICLQKRKTKGAVFLPTWFQISEVFLVRQKARGRLEEGPCFSRRPEVSGKCDTRKYIHAE